MKVAIYTAIIGGVDDLIEPGYFQECDMFAFVDNNVGYSSNSQWTIRNIHDEHIPNNIPGDCISLSRYFKMLPHIHFPDYDYTIWVDGSDTLRNKLSEIIPFDEDWISFKHPTRDCIYAEFDAIIYHKKDTPENTNRIRQYYKDLRVPKSIGMAACSAIWRKNTATCHQFCEFWWNEFVKTGSTRDQPIWAYCNWKSPVNHRFLPGDHMKNKYIRRIQHKRKV